MYNMSRNGLPSFYNEYFFEEEDSRGEVYLDLDVPDELDLSGEVIRFASEFLAKQSDTRDNDGGEKFSFKAVSGVWYDSAH